MRRTIRLILSLFIINGYVLAMRKEDFKPRVKYVRAEIKKRIPKVSFMVTQYYLKEPYNTGSFIKKFQPGIYKCVVCSEKLFSSKDKYKSQCGYASFTKPFNENVVD